MLSLINYLLPLLGKIIFTYMVIFYIILFLIDYSTEHLKTGLMILEAYVLIAPERVISVNIDFYYQRTNFLIYY